MYTKDELTQMDQQQLIELAESMNIKVKKSDDKETVVYALSLIHIYEPTRH